MAKLTLDNIASGYASVETINSNFDAIEAAIENTLSRDGTSPNQMTADLDMNGHYILNALAGGGDEEFRYIGDWVTATAYEVNNLVFIPAGTTGAEPPDGATLICAVAHTSGTCLTDYNAGKWKLLARRGASGAGSGDMLKSENLSGLNYVTARSNLGLGNAATGTIGVQVQAYDENILKANVADVLTKGFAGTPYNFIWTSPFTPDEANGNLQYSTNTGALTLNPPANSTSMVLSIAQGGSSGAITTSSFDKVTGTAPSGTTGQWFGYVTVIGSWSHLHWQAMQ